MNWDELFIKMAFLVSEKSKDPSTKVGCVLVTSDNAVIATGFNGFPRGVKEEEEVMVQVENFPAFYPEKKLLADRWARPAKYSWVEHAERNAIYNAARKGVSTVGAKAYLNWEPQPCADCCRGLIQAGIVEIIGPNIPFKGAGAGVSYHLDFAKVMCEESGVIQRVVMWDFV
jgi:dCMP deaminase